MTIAFRQKGEHEIASHRRVAAMVAYPAAEADVGVSALAADWSVLWSKWQAGGALH